MGLHHDGFETVNLEHEVGEQDLILLGVLACHLYGTDQIPVQLQGCFTSVQKGQIQEHVQKSLAIKAANKNPRPNKFKQTFSTSPADATVKLKAHFSAAHFLSSDTVANLIMEGANIEVRMPDPLDKHRNRTPLMAASHKGDVHLVMELLGYGAQIAAVDRYGRNALDHWKNSPFHQHRDHKAEMELTGKILRLALAHDDLSHIDQEIAHQAGLVNGPTFKQSVALYSFLNMPDARTVVLKELRERSRSKAAPGRLLAAHRTR
ncbi:MAG: ankyrin repeat domain-containing protein [Dongiaceae bacterium]